MASHETTRHEIHAVSPDGLSSARITLTTNDPTADVDMRLMLEKAGLMVASHVATPVASRETR